MLKKRYLTSVVLSIFFLTVSGFASETVLLYFYGENPQVPTAPYTKSLIQQVEPLLAELAQQGYPIRGVDAYQNVDFALQWEIKELPTFIMVVNDKAVDRINGVDELSQMKPRLLQMLGIPQNTANQPLSSPQSFPQLPVSSAPTHLQASQIQPVSAVMTQNTPQPTQTSNSYNDNPFLKATVRLRIDGSNSHDWGTGTIIEAKNGQAIILTCGHIFRESRGEGLIEVNLFDGNSSKTLHGKLIRYDDGFDIAFVSITPSFPVTSIPLAPADFVLHEGDAVVSAGCDGGAAPTLKQHRVLSLNSVFSQTTPAFYYVQVDNPPVGGRSGGGLFSREGYLVGVCNAKDHQAGFFAPLWAIRHEMSKHSQLAAMNQNPDMSPVFAQPAPLVANQISSPTVLQELPITSFSDPPKPLESKNSGTLSLEEQATLDQIRRYQQDGAKIVCVIYSERDPNQSIDVIQLESASTQFVNALREQKSTMSVDSATSSIVAPSTLHNGNARIPTTFPVAH